MIKTIIFDFDGTLANSIDIFLAEVMTKLTKKYGLPEITQKELDIMRNEGTKKLISALNISPLKVPMLLLDMKTEMTNRINEVKAFEGVKESLEELTNKGCILGVLTSNSVENVSKFLENNNFPKFEFIYSENDLFGKDKTLNHLITKYKLSKEEVIYVGDETRDIEACKKKGVKVIGVTWGYNSKSLLETMQPDFIADKPQELVSLITNQ